MSQKYIIDLVHNDEKLEVFEIEDKNLLEVKVQLPGPKIVSGSDYKVILNLSADAMIGMGTELIRKGMRLKEQGKPNIQEFEHIQPLSINNTCQKIGIYLTPESCELLVSGKDFGKVDEVIQNLKKQT